MPLYKGEGSESKPNNYSGITLESCKERLTLSFFHQQLYCCVEHKGPLPDSQYGLRRGCLTVVDATNLKTTIENGVSSFGRYYVRSVDFEKAFGTVDRTNRIRKLHDFGVGGSNLPSINCCITQNQFLILDSSLVSEPILTCRSVPQGDIASPLFFHPIPDGAILSVERNDFFYAIHLAIGFMLIVNNQFPMNNYSQYCEAKDLSINVSYTKVVKI